MRQRGTYTLSSCRAKVASNAAGPRLPSGNRSSVRPAVRVPRECFVTCAGRCKRSRAGQLPVGTITRAGRTAGRARRSFVAARVCISGAGRLSASARSRPASPAMKRHSSAGFAVAPTLKHAFAPASTIAELGLTFIPPCPSVAGVATSLYKQAIHTAGSNTREHQSASSRKRRQDG
jgi:hypothetical protein